MLRFFSRLSPDRSPDRSSRLRRRAPRHQPGLESLEPRTLLTSAPTGLVPQFTRGQISGWAYNADDGAAPVTVEINVNGSVTSLTADQSVATLPRNVASIYHGFSFTMPTLPPGASRIIITAISPTSGVRRIIRSGTILNPLPIGRVTLTDTQLTGWAFDADSASPIQVRVDIDGVAGTPFTTDVPRDDLLKTYKVQDLGFTMTGNFAGHVVEVYAYDAPTNTPRLIFTNNHRVIGRVEVNDGFTVSGWVQDTDNRAADVTVRVMLDGVKLQDVTTSTLRDDLTKLLGAPAHGFSVSVPGLTPGRHVVAVYAFDPQSPSSAPVLIGQRAFVNTPPIGKVTSIDSTQVAGWAFDPNLGTSPATVNVYVDDQLFKTVTANENRPGLQTRYGTAIGSAHGFTIDLSSLPAGSHAITVTVNDDRVSDQPEVVIYDNFINNHPPIGGVGLVTGIAVSGWAFDPDYDPGTQRGGASPTDVDIYIDGVYTDTITADQPSPTHDAALGSANHGWSYTLPALAFGRHRIAFYAAESQGNVSVLIGSTIITNNRPIGAVETVAGTGVIGWAADPDRLGESLQIQVYINGELVLTGPANVQRNDLATNTVLAAVPGFSAYGYNLSFASPLSAGTYQVDVFAVDPNNGYRSPLGSQVLTVS